jgi:hypothetical protein
MRNKLAVCAILAAFTGFVTTATATAAPIWQECGTLEEGAFETSSCTKVVAVGSFEWQNVAESKEATSEGTLEIADGKEGPNIKCHESASGSVGAEGEGEISSVTFTACEVTKTGSGESSCSKSKTPTLKALDLPWHTALAEEGTAELRDSLTASGKGPGLELECTGEKAKVVSECDGATSTIMTNDEAEGSVQAEFESKSATLKCKQKVGVKCDEETSAALKGTVTVTGVKTGLEVQFANPEWWVNNGGLAVFRGLETYLTRTILATKVKIKNANLTVECEKSASAAGRIWFGYGFEPANITLENCTVTNPANCKINGRQIVLNRQIAHLRWKEAMGEEAVIWFWYAGGERAGTLAEFSVENEGAACAVANTYKLKGEYIAELKNSATEETHKKYAPGNLLAYYVGAPPNRGRREISQVELGPAGGLVDGEIAGEYEFAFNGTLNGKAFRIKAP